MPPPPRARQKVVSCSTDGTITVTDLTTGDCTMTLRGHEGIVLAVAFDRSRIISASDDGTLRTWVWAARGPKQVTLDAAHLERHVGLFSRHPLPITRLPFGKFSCKSLTFVRSLS